MGCHYLDCLRSFVRQEWLLSLYFLLFLLFAYLWHPSLVKLVGYVDYRAVLSVFGFLIVVKALEDSGLLAKVAYFVAVRAGSERSFSVLVVASTVLLAALVTNDLALFAFVPIVLAAPISGGSKFRTLVLLALASNVGAFLSPVGNPQKILLWQISGMSFVSFVSPFIIPFLVLFAGLLGYTALIVKGRGVRITSSTPQIHRRAAVKDGLAFILYLVLLALGYWQIAVVFALLYYLAVYPRVFTRIDWLFLVLLVVLFMDFGMLSAHFKVSSIVPPAILNSPRGVFSTAFVLTQILSDVPAAILLSRYTHQYVALAMGTTVGAMGVVVASIANIIAVRLSDRKYKYLLFHKYSLPFALFAFAVVYILL